MKKAAFVFLALILIYLLFAFGFSEIILSSQFFSRTIQGLTELFLPPRDLYSPLFIKDLNASREGETITVEFKNKYLGPHEFGLLLKDSFKDFMDYKKMKLTLRLKVSFFVNGKTVFSKDVQNQFSPFSGKYGDGIFLLMYKCPEELPLNAPVVCEVKVMNPDVELVKKYGSVRFFIERISSL